MLYLIYALETQTQTEFQFTIQHDFYKSGKFFLQRYTIIRIEACKKTREKSSEKLCFWRNCKFSVIILYKSLFNDLNYPI